MTETKKRRPSIRRLLLSVVFIYTSVTLFAYLWGERMMFVPPPPSPAAIDPVTFVTTDDGTKIATVHVPAPETPTEPGLIVIHSHGNAEDLGTVRWELDEIASRLRVAVIGYDYPGYGASDGNPSERGACDAIEAVYRHVREVLGYSPERIVIYGRSVGSGPSLYLAAQQPVGGLIVESGFVSAFRVITGARIFPVDRFPNLSRVEAVDVPTLFFVGNEDRIVAPWHGERLFGASPAKTKQLVTVQGAGHNNLALTAGELYWNALRNHLQIVRKDTERETDR